MLMFCHSLNLLIPCHSLIKLQVRQRKHVESRTQKTNNQQIFESARQKCLSSDGFKQLSLWIKKKKEFLPDYSQTAINQVVLRNEQEMNLS